MDIGYASQKVTMYDEKNHSHIVAGHNGKTQLIIAAPFISKSFKEELAKIDTILGDESISELDSYIVVANDKHQNPECKNLNFLIDSDEEFGDWYGVRLCGEPLEGEFTKSLILISKDGALFYDEYPRDINETFDLDTLSRKILSAQTCYTGKGCH